jgi:hypothetical protein
MIPPLPPPMPPWPGSKPPWELIREQEGQQAAEGQPQPQEQQPQQQPAAPPQQAMLPQMMGMRPQVLHGLVPPQMLSPTYPTWITPPPYFRPLLPMQQPVPQPAQVPVRQQQQQAAPQPRPAPTQTAQQGPVRVARTEEKPADPQPFRPVMPVNHPGIPLGARERHYWRHGQP